MKVAVVTPYYKVPPDWLGRCLESVRDQTYPSTHILVADGLAQDVIDTFDVQQIDLPTGTLYLEEVGHILHKGPGDAVGRNLGPPRVAPRRIAQAVVFLFVPPH